MRCRQKKKKLPWWGWGMWAAPGRSSFRHFDVVGYDFKASPNRRTQVRRDRTLEVSDEEMAAATVITPTIPGRLATAG
jgi:hypothetical protein